MSGKLKHLHKYHHVNKGKTSPWCELCEPIIEAQKLATLKTHNPQPAASVDPPQIPSITEVHSSPEKQPKLSGVDSPVPGKE